MRRTVASAMLMIFVLAVVPAWAGGDREIEASHELGRQQDLYVDFHSGELLIEPASGNRVTLELSFDCKWDRDDCERSLDDAEIRWDNSDRRLRVSVDGLSTWERTKIETEAVLRVPSRANLRIDMGAGRLEIEEHAGDLRVDMGAGELRVFMDESAVESVSIDVAVGDARLRGADVRLAGRRSMLIGSEVYWDHGKGGALVDLELGAGEATVWLE